jgi:hypothetical protein
VLPAASARSVEAAVQDAAVEAVQPQAGGHAGAALPAAQDAVAGAQQAAAVARVGAVVLQPEAAERAGAVVLPPEAAERDAVAVLPRVAPGGQEPQGALPSALAFRRDQALPWPVPRPVAQFARAMQRLRIAWP